jgi:hypothetical protein
MRIDHLVYGAPDLAAAADDLEARFGVRARMGGKHLGLGTHNALLALGPSTYLEIIAPDPEQPPPPGPRPFGLDALSSACLVGWAIGCDDIDAAISEARNAGYDPGDPIEMTRTTSTGTELRWRLTLNAIGGGPVPFLIAWGDTDQPATTAIQGLVLEAVEIEHPEPESLATIFRALHVDVDIRPAEASAIVAHIRGPAGRQELR